MTQIAISGNITAPVELRYTQGGKAVGSVTVAVNRGKDDQKQTDFHRVTLWESLAENAAQLEKGTRVVVIGRLAQKEYQTKEGETRQTWEVTADSFGPDLRYATAQVTRTRQDGTKSPQTAAQPATGAYQAAGVDNWGGTDDGTTPF